MTPTPLSKLLLLLALALPAAAEDDPPVVAPEPTPVVEPTAGTARLTLDFRGARLGQVLDFLSKEAGYVIANPIELPAPITLVSKQMLTPEEAVEALNGVLVDLGYAAIVRGRTLRVVTLPAARQQNLPVVVGADPARMPEGDRMVTQVIPVEYALVKDLAANLLPLINTTYAVLSANDSANILVLTDTQSNVRRIAAVVRAIDSSISGEQQIRVFHLLHADAEKVAQLIGSLYGKQQGATARNPGQEFAARMMGMGGGGGRGGNQQSSATEASQGARGGEVAAAADNGTNSLVVRASPGMLGILEKVIEQLDVDTTGKDGVLLYRVRNGKAVDLAKSLNDLFQGMQTLSTTSTTQNQRGGQTRQQPAQQARPQAPAAAGGAAGSDSSLDLSGQVRVVADETSNSVLVLTAERNFERLRRILVDMDAPMRQVLVRVLVAEVTLEKGLDLGVQLDGFNPRDATGSSRMFSDFNLFDSTLGLNSFLLNTTDFRAAVRALASNTKFDVLSRPYILTTDNRLATVNVSQEVPVPTGSRADQQNNITTTFDRRDVGIILNVTPQINSDGRVVLDVSQELSALSDASIPIAPDVTSPIINKRTMTTRVAVDNGQTVVVGGLVNDTLTETVRKIPILGDIPLLGIFFRRTERVQAQTELLVFLTPQVINNPEDLSDLREQLSGEMRHLPDAVKRGTLQRHLDQLDGLRVGDPLPAPVEARPAPGVRSDPPGSAGIAPARGTTPGDPPGSAGIAPGGAAQ